MTRDIRSEIQSIVNRVLRERLGPEFGDVEEEVSIISTGMDSIDLLECVLRLEEHFECQIEPEASTDWFSVTGDKLLDGLERSVNRALSRRSDYR